MVPRLQRPQEIQIAAPDHVPATWPTATYRVQLHPGFGFDDAAALAPYLAALGVSHLYCSPVLQAVAGSTHGYDVVDHGRISEQLGGAAGFARMSETLAEHGLSVILDTVPNHMALAGSDNRWWWDVLEDGPASRYARHFDIDWSSPDLDSGPSVLMPILGDHLGRVVEAGELRLERRGGAFVVVYHEHELPLSPRSLDDVLALASARAGSDELAQIARDLGSLPHAAHADRQTVEARHHGKVGLRQRLAALTQLEPAVGDAIDAELVALAADPDALHSLLHRQNYRLAHWRTADEELDYRRFFSITTLAGLRVEDEAVFDESHRLIADLIRSGQVTGLRVDHVDGLRDPAQYLERLRALAPDAYIVVEKILQRGETLPETWPVQGTSGYDHLIAVNELFVEPACEQAMTELHASFTGVDEPFSEVEHTAKRDVMHDELASETERLTGLLVEVCARHRRHSDHTRRDLRAALTEVLAAMPVYRTYIAPGREPTAEDRAQVAAALAAAAARNPEIDSELLELIGRVLLLEERGHPEVELAVRFQQLSAPVMAKGVEDTAFYRYARLVSLNEVGGDPGSFGSSVDEYHRHCAHLTESWPGTMLTLSTHDTKRSADVRARIDLLSEMPHTWADAVKRWADHNEQHRSGDAPDREAELLLYQTLVGAWPIDADRAVAAMAKSTKEAKTLTSWTSPDEAYDAAVESFVRSILDDPVFVADLESFLADNRIVELGRLTSLAQTALLLTGPGVADIYQGTELWDLSLVDPDNRRPVDHSTRAALLDELHDAKPEQALEHIDDGGAKLWLIASLLRQRRRRPDLFQGRNHEALEVSGPRANHVVAYARGGLAVVVPRLLVCLADDWQDTTVQLPAAPRAGGGAADDDGPTSVSPGSVGDGAGGAATLDWRNMLTGDTVRSGEHQIASLLSRFPVAVLVADAG